MDYFNLLFRRITVLGSSLGKSNEVKATVEGVDGETDESPLLGTLGIIANPKPKDATGAATGIAAVGSDELNPIATMDRRLSEARGPIPTGTITMPGYEGQHVTVQEGSVPGQPKIAIEVEGARITLEGGLFGPTIVVERDGPPAVTVTMGPGGTVDVVRAGIAENVALYAMLQAYINAQQTWVIAANSALVALLAPVEPGPVKPLTAALNAALAALNTAKTNAANPALASSAVLRASPT